MSDDTPETRTVAIGAAWVARCPAGSVLRITARSVVSLVAFNADDPTERFDQARTRVYNMRIWGGAGEQLFSKHNNPMLRIVADGLAPLARHDLQLGFDAAAHGTAGTADFSSRDVLGAALEPYGIAAAVIPAPFNLFLDVAIDTRTGALSQTDRRPSDPVTVELEAMMDLIVAAVAPPDPAAPEARSVEIAIG